jgi:hypothetical protein
MALWGIIELMVPLTSIGLLEAVRRYLPELAAHGSKAHLQSFIKWVTAIRWLTLILFSILIFLFRVEISKFLGFNEDQESAVATVSVLVFSVLAFRFSSEMLECLLEQRQSQTIQALQAMMRLVGVIFMWMHAPVEISDVLLLDAIASLVCLTITEIFLIRHIRSAEPSGASAVSVQEIVRFSWHMLGANLLQAAANPGALRVIVVRGLGLEIGGMFAFLQQLLQIVGRYLPANLLANIIRPMLIARFTASRDTRIVSTATSLLWKSNLLIITGGAIALAAAGDELIGLASGGRFPDAGWIMLTLFVALGGTTQGQLLTQTFQIFDYSRQWRNLSLIALLTPFAVWAGARYGLMGVAVGMVCGTWIRNAIAIFWLKKQATTIELDWAGGVRIVLSGLALVAVGTMADRFAGPWIALAFALLAYAAAMLLLRPLHLDEVDFLGRAARKLAAPARLLARR